jgi:hypothetical protein
MAAPPPPRRYIAPADVQGGPLARLLIAHPDAAAAVFDHLTYADATHLRAGCVGFRGAVAEHPWTLPVPLPSWVRYARDSSAVRTPAGLARWRAAFPEGRTLELVGEAYGKTPPHLHDADVAPVADWSITGVYANSVRALTRAGLAALCGPALTDLCMQSTPQLSCADVAAATAASPRLRTVHLSYIGPLADGDLAAWGGVHALTLATMGVAGFTFAGVRHLTAVRELALPLVSKDDNWVGDALLGLTHLTRLRLGTPSYGLAAVSGHAGLIAPGGLPRSLQHMALHGLYFLWPLGIKPDGGAALLRPLAGVPGVSLSQCGSVTDGGLCALAGTTRLELYKCNNVTGERLEPLGLILEELTVELCYAFTGSGLGSLAALRRLTVVRCRMFGAGALVGVAAGCPVLERVAVKWGGLSAPDFDVATAEAALAAAAGAGSWASTRSDGAWTAVRRPQQTAAAPAPGGATTCAAPVAALTSAPAAGAATGGTGDDTAAPTASLPDDAPALPPARRQRVGE